MPGLVKIGMTGDTVEARLTALSAATGVPLPFECHFAAEVADATRVEKTLHQLFAEVRINPKREFFRLDPEKVVLAISIGPFKEVTPGSLRSSRPSRRRSSGPRPGDRASGWTRSASAPGTFSSYRGTSQSGRSSLPTVRSCTRGRHSARRRPP
jgi:hypothetical protein